MVLLLSGLQVARRYEGEDRLIALTTAAGAAAGDAAERLDVVPLPDPVEWVSIERWVRAFSRDGQAGRIERCLFTAGHAGYQENILPLLFDCATTPYFLGFADHIIWLDHLARIQEEFGWDRAGELVFNLGAKLVGRGRGEPERFRRDAIALMGNMEPVLAQAQAGDSEVPYDEDGLVKALVSADLETAFGALAQQLEAGVSINRLIDTCLLLAADRMARVPVERGGGLALSHPRIQLGRGLAYSAALRRSRSRGPRASPRSVAVLRRPLAQHSLPSPERASDYLGDRRGASVHCGSHPDAQCPRGRPPRLGLWTSWPSGGTPDRGYGPGHPVGRHSPSATPHAGDRFRGVGAFCRKRPPGPGCRF